MGLVLGDRRERVGWTLLRYVVLRAIRRERIIDLLYMGMDFVG